MMPAWRRVNRSSVSRAGSRERGKLWDRDVQCFGRIAVYEWALAVRDNDHGCISLQRLSNAPTSNETCSTVDQLSVILRDVFERRVVGVVSRATVAVGGKVMQVDCHAMVVATRTTKQCRRINSTMGRSRRAKRLESAHGSEPSGEGVSTTATRALDNLHDEKPDPRQLTFCASMRHGQTILQSLVSANLNRG